MQTVDCHHLSIRRPCRVLDLGCGQGRHAIFIYYFSAASEVFAVDLSASEAKSTLTQLREFASEPLAKPFLSLAANGSNLPFADDAFDIVICSEVLEHIPQYTLFLEEIRRILKTDGQLVISVPRAWPEQICWWLSREYHQVEGGHVRIFNGRALRQEIESFGFKLRVRHWAHALHVPYWWLRCLFWSRGENTRLARWYHSFLVWDLMKKPRITRWLERLLNPLLGKSLVMYFDSDKADN